MPTVRVGIEGHKKSRAGNRAQTIKVEKNAGASNKTPLRGYHRVNCLYSLVFNDVNPMALRTTVILFLFVALTTASAQTDDVTRKLQIAQRLEQSGDWKQASLLYEDLLRTDSTNYVFFDALRRSYSQLKEYDKSIWLIRQRLRLRPTDTFLEAYLGGALFDAGRTASADSVWDALLASQPRQRQFYVLIAQQLQERRLFGKAIDMYVRGRSALGNPAEFAQELALLYSATQSYGDAVSEYLLLLEQTPHQIGYIQSRIASFTIRDQGLHAAEEVIARAIERRPQNIQFRILFAWVLMEQDRYADALPVYRTIDSLGGAHGGQLFAFAGIASRQAHYAEATRAYADVVSLSPPSGLRPQALFGMAEAMERSTAGPVLSSATGTLDGSSTVPESVAPPDSALMLYGKVIQEYPGSQPALQALYRIGVIRYERLFDLDGAIRALGDLRQDRRAGQLAWEALLTESDVLVAKGDVSGARDMLLSAPQEARTYLQDRFTLHYARLLYFLGSFGEARQLLDGVTRSVDKDAANDALALSYHIQDAAADSATLMLFARGEVLTRERKFAEAFGLFRDVSTRAGTASLASRSRLASADMLVRLGKTQEAIALLDSIVTTFQTDVLRDRALYTIGTLYQDTLHDTSKARAAYDKFLILFPHSLFADEVRRRVRSLQEPRS